MGSTVPVNSKIYSAFDPRSISQCILWIDATDASSITGTSSVTAIRDKSGTGSSITLISGTVSRSSTGMGPSNLPYLNMNSGRFKGTFSTALNKYTNTTFIVTGLDSVPGNGYSCVSFAESATGSSVFYRPLDYTTTGAFRSYFFQPAATGFSVNYSGASVTTYQFIWSSYYDGTTNNSLINSLYHGGVNSGSVNIATASSTSPGYFFVGGSDNDSANSWPGRISEILIYNSVLSTYERQQVEGYLYRKYGFSSSLAFPTNHSFYRIPLYSRPFSPLDIPNCQLWLDAADQSSFTFSGSSITSWNDKSGNQNHATSAATFYPTLSNNAVVFNGGQYLVTNYSASAAIDNVFIVYKLTSSANFNVFSTGAAGGRTFEQFSSSMYVTVNGVGVWGAVIATTLNKTNVHNFIRNNTGGCQFYSDGSNTYTSATNYTTSGSKPSVIGAWNVGAGYSNFMTGTISEIIAFNTTLTTYQRQLLEGYLAHKWKLTTNLISSHPYRLSPSLRLAFNPLQISGCRLWLDAADYYSMTITGGAVTQWNDKSGNGNHASGGVSPTFSNNSVVFDGTKYLNTSYTAVPTSETICVVATITGTTARNYFIVASTNTNERGYQANLTSGVYTINWDKNGVARYASTSGIQQNVRFMSTGVFTGSAGTTNLNGGSQSASAAFSFSGTGQTKIGAIAAYVSTTSWIGSINEIIIFNSNITLYQQQQVEGYLAQKWQLQANLPSTHPFKKIKI